ncbi:MAG: hypothetical protein NZ528_01850 [Caldilineales bacterium]|nr:hypothetical protein [Caldilineales bacterium]MDW8318790.1 hypothetical protein [Anaerolineae bacterium]
MTSARGVGVVRRVARLWSLVSLFILVLFGVGSAVGDFPRFTPRDAIGFLFFPVGVIAGLALAWRRELAGGLVVVGSLAAFYVQNALLRGRWPAGPWFLLLATPGFLFLGAWWLDRRRRPPNGGAVP